MFVLRGAGQEQFVHQPDSPSRFAGDPKGSLAVEYDSARETSRLFTVLSSHLTQDEDFVFGGVLTVRPDGFHADPFGFHLISFSLFNAATTGDDRTGDIADFRSDTFDTLEFAYFPNVSPLFGGPFLSAVSFGERLGDDAFLNFAFGTQAVSLAPGQPYLVEATYLSALRTLTLRISAVRADGTAFPLPGGVVVADLSHLSGFSADSLGLTAYQDGFNEFAPSGRSLRAIVDYDLLFVGRIVDGRLPLELARALRRFGRRSRLLMPADPTFLR